LDDWIVDIQYSQHFNDLIANNLRMLSNNVDNVDIREDNLHKAIYYYKRGLSILEPWRKQRKYKLDEEKILVIYQKLSETETELCECLSKFGNYGEAIDYCDKAILHANIVIIEEIRIHLVFHAMTQKGKNLRWQKEFSEAKIVYEDVYNLVAEAYYVDHPLVLKPANFLIDILLQT
jgi:tetratricopeptide (TPR) repeat protein